MTGTNFSSWYRQDEGTFAAGYSLNSLTANYPALYFISDGTVGSSLGVLQHSAQSGRRYFNVDASSVNQVNLITADSFMVTGARLADSTAYKLNDFAFSRNGTAAQTDTSGIVPTVNRLDIGCRINIGFINGHISRIQYFKKRLSNSRLQQLSK